MESIASGHHHHQEQSSSHKEWRSGRTRGKQGPKAPVHHQYHQWCSCGYRQHQHRQQEPLKAPAEQHHRHQQWCSGCRYRKYQYQKTSIPSNSILISGSPVFFHGRVADFTLVDSCRRLVLPPPQETRKNAAALLPVVAEEQEQQTTAEELRQECSQLPAAASETIPKDKKAEVLNTNWCTCPRSLSTSTNTRIHEITHGQQDIARVANDSLIKADSDYQEQKEIGIRRRGSLLISVPNSRSPDLTQGAPPPTQRKKNKNLALRCFLSFFLSSCQWQAREQQDPTNDDATFGQSTSRSHHYFLTPPWNDSTVLHKACFLGRSPRTIKSLILKQACAASTPDSITGRLPLHYIVIHLCQDEKSLKQQQFDLRIVNLLVDAYLPAIHHADKFNDTPLDIVHNIMMVPRRREGGTSLDRSQGGGRRQQMLGSLLRYLRQISIAKYRAEKKMWEKSDPRFYRRGGGRVDEDDASLAVLANRRSSIGGSGGSTSVDFSDEDI